MKGLIIIAPHLLYAVNIDGIVNIDNIAEHFLQQNIDIGNNGFIPMLCKGSRCTLEKRALFAQHLMSASFAEPQSNSGCVYPLWAGENSLAQREALQRSQHLLSSEIEPAVTLFIQAVQIFFLCIHMAVSMCACAKETDLLTYAQAVLCIFFGWLGFVEVHLSGSREHLRGTEVVVILCARALLSSLASQQLMSTWMNWALWRKGAAFVFLSSLPQLHKKSLIISSTNISILFFDYLTFT